MTNEDNELIVAFELLRLGKVNESEKIAKKIEKKVTANIGGANLFTLLVKKIKKEFFFSK